MFEVLTEQEAKELMCKLSSGYESSRQLGRELTAWGRSAVKGDLQRSYFADAGKHAAIRSENTAIRWQIKREALSQ